MHPHSEDSAIHHGAVGPSAAHICVFFLNLKLIPSEMQVLFFLIVLIKKPYFLNTLLQLDPGASVYWKAFFCHFLLQQLCSFTLDRAPVRILSDGFWFLLFFFSQESHCALYKPRWNHNYRFWLAFEKLCETLEWIARETLSSFLKEAFKNRFGLTLLKPPNTNAASPPLSFSIIWPEATNSSWIGSHSCMLKLS